MRLQGAAAIAQMPISTYLKWLLQADTPAGAESRSTAVILERLDQIAAAMAKLVSAPQARPVNTKAADLSLDAELISGKLRDRGLPSSTIRQVIAVLGGEGR